MKTAEEIHDEFYGKNHKDRYDIILLINRYHNQFKPVAVSDELYEALLSVLKNTPAYQIGDSALTKAIDAIKNYEQTKRHYRLLRCIQLFCGQLRGRRQQHSHVNWHDSARRATRRNPIRRYRRREASNLRFCCNVSRLVSQARFEANGNRIQCKHAIATRH